MRVVGVALVLGVMLAAMPASLQPRAANACSYIAAYGYEAISRAVEWADLLLIGRVVDDQLIYDSQGSQREDVYLSTVAIEHVLKGEHDNSSLVMETRFGPCGDAGAQVRTGDSVYLALVWQPSGSRNNIPVDHRWMMFPMGSAVRFISGEAHLDEPLLQEVINLGTTEEFLQALGALLELPESEIETLIAGQAQIEGSSGGWTPALQAGSAAALLAAVAIALSVWWRRRA